MSTMINLASVTKKYQNQDGTLVALRDVSFEIEQGDFVCMVGTSGSGKSTLLKIIAGLEPDYDGQVTIDGQDLRGYLAQRGIALVAQKYTSFPWMTIAENIHEGNRSAGQDRVDQLLKKLGLFRFKNMYPGQLSGGMQQRVAIARALIQDTDIILFDEPFGALDVQTRSQIQRLLLSLWKEEQKTILFVTHSVDEALMLGTRVVVLESHPGTVNVIHDVPFAYPRETDLQFTDEFTQLKKTVSYRLRAQSILSAVRDTSLGGDAIGVGVFTWAGSAPWYYAQGQEMFRDMSLGVSVGSYSSYGELLGQLVAGTIDAANVTLDLALRTAAEDPRFVVIPPYVMSNGADALVSRPDVASVADLRGKRIGVERRGIGYFFLAYLLTKENIPLGDVQVVDILAHDAGAQMLNREIDAAVLWDPWLSEMLRLDDVQILESSKDHPVLLDALLVRREFYEAHQSDFDQMTHILAEAFGLVSQKENNPVVASYLGMGSDELADFLPALAFFDHDHPTIKKARTEIAEHFAREEALGMETPDSSNGPR